MKSMVSVNMGDSRSYMVKDNGSHTGNHVTKKDNRVSYQIFLKAAVHIQSGAYTCLAQIVNGLVLL